MTSLVDELQLFASDPLVAVSTLLRKALVLASKLNVQDMPTWIGHELYGYEDWRDVPDYRVVYGEVKARTYQGWQTCQFQESAMKNTMSKQYVVERVAEIESLISFTSKQLVRGYSPEQIAIMQEVFNFQGDFRCFLGHGIFVGILDEVRSKILRFALALDSVGVRGEGLSFTKTERADAGKVLVNSQGGNITIGVAGTVSGSSSVAVGSGARCGTLTMSEVQELFSIVTDQLKTSGIRTDSLVSLEAEIKEVLKSSDNGSVESKAVHSVMANVLDTVKDVGKPILVAGLKAYLKGWCLAHGITWDV